MFGEAVTVSSVVSAFISEFVAKTTQWAEQGRKKAKTKESLSGALDNLTSDLRSALEQAADVGLDENGLSFCDWLGEETEYIYDSALETKEERDSRIEALLLEGQRKFGFKGGEDKAESIAEAISIAFDYCLKLRFGHLNDDDRTVVNMTVTYGEETVDRQTTEIIYALDPTLATDREWLKYQDFLASQSMTAIGTKFTVDELYIPLNAIETAEATFYPPHQDSHGRLFDLIESNNRLEIQLFPETVAEASVAHWPIEHSHTSTFTDTVSLVVSVDERIAQWLETPDFRDDHNPVLVLSGDPGSGKSTVARRLSKTLAKTEEVNVAYISLKDVATDSQIDDIEALVVKYILSLPGRDFVVSKLPTSKPLVLIFDGLDEYAARGPKSKKAAWGLLGSILRYGQRCSEASFPTRVLVTSRTTLLRDMKKEVSPKECKPIRLELLPYVCSESELGDICDPDFLLCEDKRITWWTNYGERLGRDMSSTMEKIFKWDDEVKLSAQPILNHLIAVFAKNILETAAPNRAEVYGTLLKGVINRNYDHAQGKAKIHSRTRAADVAGYLEFMEAAAIMAWHNGGSITDLKPLKNECGSERAKEAFDCFKSEARIKDSIIAGYFHLRNKNGEESYEFVHYSFMEYLVSRRIVGELTKMLDRKVCPITSMPKLYDMLGCSELTDNTLSFIRAELSLFTKKKAASLQKYMMSLFMESLLEYSFDETFFDKERNGTLFSTKLSSIRNVQGNILALHSCAAKVTGERMGVSFNLLLQWLGGIGVFAWESNVSSFFNGLEPIIESGEDEYILTLPFAQLSSSDMSNSFMEHAIFTGAMLDNTIVVNADMKHANFNDARLVDAKCSYAHFEHASLEKATLHGAHFDHAHLENAHLLGAELEGAKFQHAHLEDADLRFAKLIEAEFGWAKMRGSNMGGAILREADLRYAELKGCNLENAILDKAKVLKKDIKTLHECGADVSKVIAYDE